MAQEFTDRAKLRLRLAAGLIGGEGRTLKLDRSNFYPEMVKVIESLTPEKKAEIKELVDWLEGYENELKRQGINNKPINKPIKSRAR